MSGWQRLAKLAVAWLALAAVLLAASRTGWTAQWTDHSSVYHRIGVDEKELSDDEVQLMYNQAHTLPDADAFLEHFRKIPMVKNITIDDAKSGCNWDENANVNFQYPGDVPWVKKQRPETEIAGRRESWHKFIRTGLIPWEKYKNFFYGRGIVVVAGNDSGYSIKRFRVILRQLRALGSSLPVELFFWKGEISEEVMRNLTATYPLIYFNDLSDPKTNIIRTTDHTPLINYQYKSVALINSRFAEAVLLDADNIPVIDPNDLFESDTYKEYGSIFWPDIARTRPQNPMWAITNTKCRMDEFEQESGQLVIDKRRYWYHLQLATWFNNDLDNYYYTDFILGDKDMFRFAWHSLKTKYGKPAKWLSSVGTLSPDEKFYCGHTFAQYHPNGSVAFLHGGTLKTVPPRLLEWQRNRGGIWQHYKNSVYEEQHGNSARVWLFWDGADYWPDKPADLPVATCIDMQDEKPKPFQELVPNFEQRFEEIGGYWMVYDQF